MVQATRKQAQAAKIFSIKALAMRFDQRSEAPVQLIQFLVIQANQQLPPGARIIPYCNDPTSNAFQVTTYRLRTSKRSSLF